MLAQAHAKSFAAIDQAVSRLAKNQRTGKAIALVQPTHGLVLGHVDDPQLVTALVPAGLHSILDGASEASGEVASRAGKCTRRAANE